jgi:hypothetical protein
MMTCESGYGVAAFCLIDGQSQLSIKTSRVRHPRLPASHPEADDCPENLKAEGQPDRRLSRAIPAIAQICLRYRKLRLVEVLKQFN